MKVIGVIFVISGIIVLSFLIYAFLQRPQQNLSPIIEDDGVKVIYETPTR